MSERKIHDVLRQYWGYEEFRPMQEEIIRSVMASRDTLALLPTGGGKSLTYQVPTLAREGLCIVVTPLIALMKDQVDNLRKRGVQAVAIHSGLSPAEIDRLLDNCVYGTVKFLYIAPERIGTELFLMRVAKMNLQLIAVDEAHCISQWGYDFRPSYLRIAELRRAHPEVPILALTASATELVTRDIMENLQFPEQNLLRGDFLRPNLSYSVRQTDDKQGQLLRLVQNVPGTGIVYVRTREATEQVAEYLRSEGITAEAYHGGLAHAERSIRQEEWIQNRVRVMVATNAFGMGIDKPDVRFVVHYSMCDSLEAYYQEAGRAGRDGYRSYAVMLYTKDDCEKLHYFFKAEFPPVEEIKRVYELVCSYLQVAIGDGEGLSFEFNNYDFCHKTSLSYGLVGSALKILEQNGLMTLLDEQDNPARLIFTCSRDSLYKLNVEGNDMDLLLRTILRTYNGVFSQFRYIDELLLAQVSGLTSERVHELLRVLWRMRVIRYIPASHSPMIIFNSERLPREDIYISPDSYRRRYDVALERTNKMLEYVTNEDKCRSRIIEEYFGQTCASDCGVCDICLARRSKRASMSIDEAVVKALQESELSVKEVVAKVAGRAERVVEVIDKMVLEGKISLSVGGKLKINN